jgi:hypothetical protein
MDLSLPADFDSSLLTWGDDDGPGRADAQQQQESDTVATETPMGEDGEQSLKQPSTTDAMKDGFSRLPSFPTSIGGFSATSGDQPAGGQSSNAAADTNANGQAAATAMANLTNLYATQMLYPLAGGDQNVSTAAHANVSAGTQQQQQQQNLMVQYALTGASAGAPFPNVSFSNKNQMDTVSSLSATTGYMSSVATRRPPVAEEHAPPPPAAAAHPAPANMLNEALPTTQLHPLGIQSSAVCPPLSAATAPASAPNAMQFNPYMFNPYSMMAGNPQLLAAFQSQQQMAAYFAAAQASAAQATTAQAGAAPANTPAPVFPPPKPKRAKKPKATAAKAKKTSKKKDDAPPFLLFDAPCELRQNFMQSQRMLNLPVHQDGNSYHYGMAVNGFHPQLNVATDPIRPLSRDQPILPPGVNVKLLDSRHKKKRGVGTERNEREQKRAQKITELIEQIRVSMEDGGWKVEMKSKYHTLSM